MKGVFKPERATAISSSDACSQDQWPSSRGLCWGTFSVCVLRDFSLRESCQLRGRKGGDTLGS